MTLEEAMHIASHRLPEEPREDEIANWRASRPVPEPAKRTRSLDTAPAAPQVDWAAVINGAIRGERAHMVEAVGQAIGTYGNDVIAEVEQMIAAAVEQLRAEFAAQIERVANEFSGQMDLVHTQGAELRAQLEEVIAKKKRTKAAKANGEHLLLPSPNGSGDAHGTQ